MHLFTNFTSQTTAEQINMCLLVENNNIGTILGDRDGGEVSPPYFEMVDLLSCSSCTSIKSSSGQ